MKKALLFAASFTLAVFLPALGGDADAYTDDYGVIWEYDYTYADTTAAINRVDSSHAGGWVRVVAGYVQDRDGSHDHHANSGWRV
ncbi:MAG: hypothetical protein J6Z49_05245 [Kiritimatiellae bacterium]|nr:hypothetical protein [Kiritimatiellia bacterium]